MRMHTSNFFYKDNHLFASLTYTEKGIWFAGNLDYYIFCRIFQPKIEQFLRLDFLENVL